VMGRHAGWLAAAAGLAGQGPDETPHIILFPEIVFDEARFLATVRATVDRVGYCIVVVSEGLKRPDGTFLAESAGSVDAFGHAQLGGAAPAIAALAKERLGTKVHWTVPDYLQRSARHLASATDLEQALAVGRAAVEYALDGRNGVMPVIERLSDAPYRWRVVPARLEDVANHEKKMPADFIREGGYGITDSCRRYLGPLIQGEAPPPYGEDGLPRYFAPKLVAIPARLAPWGS
jgi:6-phosphofructokinase